MSGNDGVRALAADRKGRSRDVPDRDLKDALVHAVVDRQLDINLRDIDIPHDAGPGHIEETVIFLLLLICHFEPVAAAADQRLVVGARLVQHLLIFRAGHVRDVLDVAGHRLRLVLRIPPVADRRIEEQRKTDGQNEEREPGEQALLYMSAQAALPGLYLRFLVSRVSCCHQAFHFLLPEIRLSHSSLLPASHLRRICFPTGNSLFLLSAGIAPSKRPYSFSPACGRLTGKQASVRFHRRSPVLHLRAKCRIA